MTAAARAWAIAAAAMAGIAAVGGLGGGAAARWMMRGGAVTAQRALAGAAGATGTTTGAASDTAPPAQAAAAPGVVRVVILDGLSRDDSHALPALERLCAGGADLEVDVGFPTRSLPVQESLWTGLTAQQLGSPYGNDLRRPDPAALPTRAPGSIAIVESHRAIAASVGFARVEPGPDADAVEPGARRERVDAWRRDFPAAATAAVASPAPLVLVHVVAVDTAAHRDGRRGAAYAAALADADRVVAAVATALPAGAARLVLADHGHLRRGGHGDAEDAVRIVRACLAPAPRVAGARVHLVDLSRWLADALGLPLEARARGRQLAAAIAHPEPDATLPRPTLAGWILAGIVLVAGGAGMIAAGGVAALWPLLSLAGWWLARGGPPSLSNRPGLDLALVAALAPAAVALVLAATPRRLLARAGTPVVVALAAAVLSGVPAALFGGPPPRVPIWTGAAGFAAALSIATAALGAAVALAAAVAALRGRSRYADRR